MVVCLCKQVTEEEIKQAIHSGVRTVKGLRKALGIAENCGACAAYVNECVKKECKERCVSCPKKENLQRRRVS